MKRCEIIKKHILDVAENGNYGIMSPPMNAQTAINELCNFFLGEDYYTININNEQANTEIVHDIEQMYKGNRKYYKKLKKKYKNKI